MSLNPTVTHATFVAVFDRPCNTNDLQDVPILMGSQNQMIWAYGMTSQGNPLQHGGTTNDRGATEFFDLPLPSGAVMIRGAMAAAIAFAVAIATL